MKVIRFVLIALAAIVGLMLIAVAVAFTSRFQTWAARKALSAQAGMTATVSRVDAGLQHMHAEQLNLRRAGLTLTLPVVDVDLSVWDAARENIQIKKLVAKGWTLDLTQPAGAAVAAQITPPREFSFLPSAYAADPAAAATSAFRGVITQIKLPVDMAVDAVELEGEVILPGLPGQPPVRAKVSISGGQLGAGREGKFSFTTVTTLAPNAPVNALNATGTLLAAMDTPRTFSRLAAEVQAQAHGSQFPNGAKLSFVVSASKANAGEAYTLVVEGPGRKLVTVQSSYPGGVGPVDRLLSGTWMLDANATDLAPFTLGRALPAFVAKGSGKFTADATLTVISLNGRLDVAADKLDALRPELAAVGAAKLGADFDVTHTGSAIRVETLSAEVSSAQPVLRVRALQPFEFNPSTGELKVAEPAKDLLNLELQGVPLAWVQPFAKGWVISGDDVRGSFLVGARNGGFAMRPVAPLTLTNLSAGQVNRPLVHAVDASLKIAADYAPQGWQAEITEVSARSGAAALLTFEARAGQLSGKDQPIKITGQWTANLPAVLKQPVAADYAVLIAGKAAGDFVASVGSSQALQAKLNLSELAVDPSVATVALPALQAEVRADIDAAGKITLSLPLLLERDGRKSDLLLAGTLTPRPTVFEIDARLTSNYLAAEDAQILATPLAKRSGPVATEGAVRASPPDKKPVWSGVSGKVTLALKKVVYQQKLEVNDLGGTIQIEAGSVKLEGLHAGLGESSDLKLGGAITFDGKAKEPYALKADFALLNFDTAPLFRALDPGKPATVEGRFFANSQLVGTGFNLPELMEHTRGDLQLTSKSGISRLLSADVSDKIQKASSTITAIGGLLGSKMADATNKGQIVSDIATALKEIPYDQLNVAVTRGDDLNFNLKDFTLISPEVRLTGVGEIRHDQGVPVLAQPLDLKLQLGTRGKLADLTNRAGLVDGSQDNLGYAGFISPLRITGTLEKPDTSEIKNIFLKAAGGSLLNNLLGR